MEKEDIIYLCKNLANLFGVPVRLYIYKQFENLYSSTTFIKDPYFLYQDQFPKGEEHISYLINDDLFYYASLTSPIYQIVVGPSRYYQADKQTLMDLAFKLSISKEDISSFVSSMRSISCLPLETILQSLCSTNLILNHERLTIEDLLIKKEIKENKIVTPLKSEEEKEITQERNSTLKIEETLQNYVEKGDIEGFQGWIKNSPAIRAGEMSEDIIRQMKNTFIVTATIISRAAIKGGLEYNQALDLSDEYIKRCEKCRTQIELNNLSYQMIMDYLNRVHLIQKEHSPLQSKIASYVYTHLSDVISLDDLCDYLYMSKPNLCLRFKKESGQTIAHFILKIKIEECKRLLKTTNKSLTSISLYLGFSSPSHLSKVFKSLEGTTPNQYKMSL